MLKKKGALDFQSCTQEKATALNLAANSVRVSRELQRKGGEGWGRGREKSI